MEKRKLFVLSLVPILLLCSCKMTRDLTNKSRTSTSSTSHTPTQSYQMFADNHFGRGFTVQGATGSVIGNSVEFPEGWTPDNRYTRNAKLTPEGLVGSNPLYTIRQHGDVYGLGDTYQGSADIPFDSDGYYKLEDTSKKVYANPTTGSLYLELNGSKEYPNRDRTSSDSAWAHLLLEGAFQNEPELISGDCDNIIFTCNITRKKFEDHMRGPADAGIHACQFLLYLNFYSTIAEDASHYFFFGIPLFDNRYTTIPEEGHVDSGGSGATGNYIYSMNSGIYLPNGLPMNSTQTIEVDIKPYLNNALAFMQRDGFYTHTTVDDLSFNNMNIGYELPGTYDIGIEISNFALTAYY